MDDCDYETEADAMQDQYVEAEADIYMDRYGDLGTIYEERGRNQVRQEAIDSGAAYYTVDPQTGETTFNWRTCDE